LAHGELQAGRQRGLDRRLIDFAITLRDMAVADLEQGAAAKTGLQRAARHQLAIVEIAA